MNANIRHDSLPDAGAVPHSLLDLRPPALWQLLRTRTLFSPASTINLASLPPGYAAWHMQVLARSSAAAEGDSWTLTLNGDGGSNYDIVVTTVSGTSRQLAQSSLALALCEGASARASCAGWTEVDFYEPSTAAWEKTGRFASGRCGDRDAAADLLYQHGMWAWRSTAAITQLTLTMTAGAFVVGSSATLWGLRAA